MIRADIDYIRRVRQAGLLLSPCLEMGAAEHGPEVVPTAVAALLSAFNVTHETTDTHGDVDYIADFENGATEISKAFSSILVCNILEHVFDPIRFLDAVGSLLKPNGTCVITTPAVWPLHYYPLDCWRINPGFYREYAKRREMEALMMEFLDYGPITETEPSLPSPLGLWSKGIHKVFNTAGRGMLFPSHVQLGVVLRKSLKSADGKIAG